MLVPIYRVYKDNHNSQFFFTRSCAEDMAHAKNAEWNIVYKKDFNEFSDTYIDKLLNDVKEYYAYHMGIRLKI